MKLKLPSSSARTRTVIVVGTLLGSLVTGAWLLQRGARTGTFTVFEGAQLFESVFRAELVLETLQQWSTCPFRQFPSCVAIDNNAVMCDCDRVAKRSIATLG